MAKEYTLGLMPTKRQHELLNILIEECAEVIQRATKMKRFGIDETQSGQYRDNRERLGREIGDLELMLELCLEAGLIRREDIVAGIENKKLQLTRWMVHSPEPV
jgi:hypothetical protein